MRADTRFVCVCWLPATVSRAVTEAAAAAAFAA